MKIKAPQPTRLHLPALHLQQCKIFLREKISMSVAFGYVRQVKNVSKRPAKSLAPWNIQFIACVSSIGVFKGANSLRANVYLDCFFFEFSS